MFARARHLGRRRRVRGIARRALGRTRLGGEPLELGEHPVGQIHQLQRLGRVGRDIGAVSGTQFLASQDIDLVHGLGDVVIVAVMGLVEPLLHPRRQHMGRVALRVADRDLQLGAVQMAAQIGLPGSELVGRHGGPFLGAHAAQHGLARLARRPEQPTGGVFRDAPALGCPRRRLAAEQIEQAGRFRSRQARRADAVPQGLPRHGKLLFQGRSAGPRQFADGAGGLAHVGMGRVHVSGAAQTAGEEAQSGDGGGALPQRLAELVDPAPEIRLDAVADAREGTVVLLQVLAHRAHGAQETFVLAADIAVEESDGAALDGGHAVICGGERAEQVVRLLLGVMTQPVGHQVRAGMQRIGVERGDQFEVEARRDQGIAHRARALGRGVGERPRLRAQSARVPPPPGRRADGRGSAAPGRGVAAARGSRAARPPGSAAAAASPRRDRPPPCLRPCRASHVRWRGPAA